LVGVVLTKKSKIRETQREITDRGRILGVQREESSGKKKLALLRKGTHMVPQPPFWVPMKTNSLAAEADGDPRGSKRNRRSQKKKRNRRNPRGEN